jgi:5,10-methylenetetrahydromethanopterin reductase
VLQVPAPMEVTVTELGDRPAGSIAAWFPQTAPVYCEMAGLSQKLIDEVRRRYSGGELQEGAQAAQLLPLDFVKLMALSGNSAEARRHWRTMVELGVDCMSVFPLGGDATTRMATVTAFAEIARTESAVPAP